MLRRPLHLLCGIPPGRIGVDNGILFDNSHSFFAPRHGLPRLADALVSNGEDGRGRFKADVPAACVDSGHRRRAGARADVRHQFAGPGVGVDKILAQLHRLLRGVDGVLDRRKGQHVPREPPPIWRAVPTGDIFAVVGTERALLVDALIRLALLELRLIQRELLVEHQNILRLFQRGPPGVEKAGTPALVPHPLVAEHF